MMNAVERVKHYTSIENEDYDGKGYWAYLTMGWFFRALYYILYHLAVFLINVFVFNLQNQVFQGYN